MNRVYVKDVTSYVDQKVLLKGWAKNLRLLGKIGFVELRDRTGFVQCVLLKENSQEYFNLLKETTIESVIEVEGIVKLRSKEQINKENEFGEYEVEVQKYSLLSKAGPLPIPVDSDGYDISEESRLKYRYLDLRRERLQKNLILKSKFSNLVREYLLKNDFVEIETPILSAPTMEGARDFLVPSRLQSGKFYALPQSPQQYKQLLMVSGFERYFQLARCFRDEDLRADRGFEFTQIDLEMSFVNQEDIMNFVENMLVNIISNLGYKFQSIPFKRFTYQEAMSQFGADKFDLRTESEKQENILSFAWVYKFPFFKKVDTNDKAEVKDGKSGWTFTHNPFSAPEDQYIQDHLEAKNIENIITQQYDLVCNGFEVGGGSIRAHDPEVLKATYRIMGYTEEEIESNIGHMLEAFNVGVPPHGGIALGLDRIVSILCSEKSLKEVIAFPMTYKGAVSVMNAPISIEDDSLSELGIKKFKNNQ